MQAYLWDNTGIQRSTAPSPQVHSLGTVRGRTWVTQGRAVSNTRRAVRARAAPKPTSTLGPGDRHAVSLQEGAGARLDFWRTLWFRHKKGGRKNSKVGGKVGSKDTGIRKCGVCTGAGSRILGWTAAKLKRLDFILYKNRRSTEVLNLSAVLWNLML